jgi:hypothetical protein
LIEALDDALRTYLPDLHATLQPGIIRRGRHRKN